MKNPNWIFENPYRIILYYNDNRYEYVRSKDVVYAGHVEDCNFFDKEQFIAMYTEVLNDKNAPNKRAGWYNNDWAIV